MPKRLFARSHPFRWLHSLRAVPLAIAPSSLCIAGLCLGNRPGEIKSRARSSALISQRISFSTVRPSMLDIIVRAVVSRPGMVNVTSSFLGMLLY